MARKRNLKDTMFQSLEQAVNQADKRENSASAGNAQSGNSSTAQLRKHANEEENNTSTTQNGKSASASKADKSVAEKKNSGVAQKNKSTETQENNKTTEQQNNDATPQTDKPAIPQRTYTQSEKAGEKLKGVQARVPLSMYKDLMEIRMNFEMDGHRVSIQDLMYQAIDEYIKSHLRKE